MLLSYYSIIIIITVSSLSSSLLSSLSLYHCYHITLLLDPAEIIQKRTNIEDNSLEYYVHYSGCMYIFVSKNVSKSSMQTKKPTFMHFYLVNRRLDEWVSDIRIDIFKTTITEEKAEEKSDNEGPERKLTRNQKRKHDEINHVQKASYLRFVNPTQRLSLDK